MLDISREKLVRFAGDLISDGSLARGGFSPLNIPSSDLKQWFREGVTLSGSDITTWLDKSPSGWGNATTPGADPDDVASIFFTRGRAADFDETAPNEFFQFGGSLAQQRLLHFPGTGGVSIGILGRNKKAADSTQALLGTNAEAQATSGICIRQDTNNSASRYIRTTLNNSSGSSDMVSITTPIGSAPEDRTFAYVLSLREHASDFDYRVVFGTKVDGLRVDVEGDFNGAPNNVDAASQGRIGARGGAISWYYTGEISEVVITAGYDWGLPLAAYLFSEILS